MNFESLNLIDPILKSLGEEGYEIPTPIQLKAIPVVLGNRDMIGCAQTGTGKTAAFALPILQKLSLNKPEHPGRKIRCLVLTPTRELAIQVEESFKAYGRHTGLDSTCVFGGVNQYQQVKALHRGVDILVATPGRLLDLMGQGHISLKNIEIFVLDEADRMLDMGFINDIRKIVEKLPHKRQSLFFSATMPREIIVLAGSIVNDPVRIEVAPANSTVDAVEQMVYFTDRKNKNALLLELLNNGTIDTALVFTRTKYGADKVVNVLKKHSIPAEAIHSNKSQTSRQKALSNFKKRKTRVLVATDIAARGIDVDDLGHVINYEMPDVAETYVHRIGRTGRAGAGGTAISFCDIDEKGNLRSIEKLISKNIKVVENHPYALEVPDDKKIAESRQVLSTRLRSRSPHRLFSSRGGRR